MKYHRTLEGFDRHGRWRSATWRRFVRSLACPCREPRCPLCDPVADGGSRVVAAHLRTPLTGAGMKADDFLVYPLSDFTHHEYHAHGHPTTDRQVEFIVRALRAGFKKGVLKVDFEHRTKGLDLL